MRMDHERSPHERRGADAEAATARQIRSSNVLTIGRLFALGLNLVSQIVIVRALTQAEYGAFAYGLAFVESARILVSAGHNRTISRFLALYEERGERDRFIGALLMEAALIVVLGALLVGGVVGLRSALEGWLADAATIAVLAIIVGMGPLQALDELLEGLFAVFGRTRAILVRSYLADPLFRLTAAIVVISAGLGARALAAGYVIGAGVGLLLSLTLAVRELRTRGLLSAAALRGARPPVREIFAFNAPLLTTELVYITLNTVSIALLGRFAGAAEVGALRAIVPAATLNLLVRRTYLRMFLPLATRLHEAQDGDALDTAYWRTATWLTVLTFPVLAATVAFAAPTTVTLFGERYAGSATYLAILAGAAFLNSAIGFNAEVVQVAGRVKLLAVANVVVAALDVVLVIFLARRHGALGVAIANGTALVVQNLLNQILASRTTAIRPLDRRWLRTLATVVALTGVLWAIDVTLHPHIVVAAIVTLVATLLLVRLTRDVLRPLEAFPELARIPGLRRLLV
jgi:O-antigen/teichoic acid export membrane protein